jgi:RNA-directed DNA polymerase
MKRIGNLYEKIISVENLRLADEKARRGKLRSYGVRHHDKNREANIQALHEVLLTKTYKTSPYDIFTIYEPKERIIYRLPYYPDRIVHHAIMNILEPIWVSVFTHNTFSCIKGRGIEGCARHVDKVINKYKGKPLYCLKIDIKKCYPSMNHDVLKHIVRKKIKDKDLLCLIDEIIDSAPGLPIGNYLSQYLANLNFAYFMHWVNETLKLDCEEYADDFVFYADSKERLRAAFLNIQRYIEEELKLEIKGNWQIFPVAASRYDKSGRAIDYVGYKFFREQKLMRKGIKKNLCRKVAKLNKWQPQLPTKEYKQHICPWLGWAKHSNSTHLLRTILNSKHYASIL